MAIERDRPYSQFNFLVEADQLSAGFQEVSGLGMEVTIAEYRNGNEGDNAVRKINGRYKVSDVTLKRGVVGKKDFFDWIQKISKGSQNDLRMVTIKLRNEERTADVMTWVLSNARPMKYTGPSLNGKGTDVAIEELVLSCERINVE